MKKNRLIRYFALCLPGGICIENDNLPDYTLEGVLQGSVTVIFIVAIAVALILMIRSGIDMITSEGSKHKLESARSRLTYAIAGLVLTLSSFAIVKLVLYFFGL